MKRPSSFCHLFALFVTVLFSVDAQAQLPDSIAITTNGSWIIEHSETNYGYNPQTETYEYMTTLSYDYLRSGGDTLIGGFTYTKMLVLPITPAGGGFTSNPQQSESYAFAYRNDMDRRAYKVDWGSTAENLWYDFNPGVGDTLWNPIAIVSTPYFVVSELDSAEFCEEQFEEIKYEGYAYPNTQRVGRFINFIRSYQDPFIADKIHAFCESSVPFSFIADVDEVVSDVRFRIFPNPAENVLNISLNNSSLSTRILIHDLMGNLVLSEGLCNNPIAIGHLSAGSYLVSVITDRGIQTQKIIKN